MQSSTRSRWVRRGMLLTAGVIIGLGLARIMPGHGFGKAVQRVAMTAKQALPAKEPPWGHLEALQIPLADSEEFFLDREQRLRPPHWFFENLTDAQLVSFLDSCQLTPEQRTELVSQVKWQVASNGFLASPPASLVGSIGAASREKIYSLLARTGENYPQVYPFRFPLDGFEAEFAETGLAPDKLEYIKNLTYTNKGTLCFADLELLPGVLSSNELSTVLDHLYRFPAYRLRLRIFPDSDIAAIVKYWGKFGRERRIRPLLDSLRNTRKTNGTSIGIGFLLPQFARLRLYTFPNDWTEPQAAREDCFWTSLNFFNEKPDMQFLDPKYVRQVLQTQYQPIEGTPIYGDLVTLVNGHGDGIHICVYIADDFVFTKNGMNQLSPWVLMKIPDMLLYFPSENGQKLVILRRKVPGNDA